MYSINKDKTGLDNCQRKKDPNSNPTSIEKVDTDKSTKINDIKTPKDSTKIGDDIVELYDDNL